MQEVISKLYWKHQYFHFVNLTMLADLNVTVCQYGSYFYPVFFSEVPPVLPYNFYIFLRVVQVVFLIGLLYTI